MKLGPASFVRPTSRGFPKMLRCFKGNRSRTFSQLKDNLDSLKDAVEQLKDAVEQLKNHKDDIKLRVKQEESSYKERIYKVTDWIYRANHLEAQANKIIAEGEEELQKSPHNSSPEVGNRIREKLKAVDKILSESNFDVVVKKKPHDVVDVIPIETTLDFHSNLDDVWRCLQDESIGVIGIYGMPGVGKSTLLRKLKNELVERQCCAEVIWVEVSRESHPEAIQIAILQQLDETCTDEGNRAAVISRSLRKIKFILILDDLWDSLNLSNIGIPPLDESIGFKIVFATSSEWICDDMKAQIKLKLKCMSQEEALKLFHITVGEDPRNSLDFAQTLNAEVCQGLPLALVAVGQTLAKMNPDDDWGLAIRELRNYPLKLQGMDDIFSIIKPSYDRLEDDTFKDCFLYISMLSDVITKDELIKLWIGEGLLNISDKNLGKYIIERLELSCLLEICELNDSVRMHGVEDSVRMHGVNDSIGVNDSVRMHGVIRAFALWIAREQGQKENKILVREEMYEKWTEAVRISMYGQTEFAAPPRPCPHVRTLLIRDTDLVSLPPEILQCTNALGVLDLSNNSRLSELPDTIGSLINLHYLNLSFTNIKELPVEVNKLENLKVLLVDYTEKLQVIPKEVISSFGSLQVFSKLGNETFNDATLLGVLECIECLSDICISLFNPQAVEKMLSSQKLQNCIRKLTLIKIEETLIIQVSILFRMVHLEELVIEDCEHLQFLTDDSQYYVLNICGLRIRRCSTIDNLRFLIFAPRLATLDVRSCGSLHHVIGSDFRNEEIKEIDERLGIFSNIKKLYLEDLPLLKYICPQVLPFPVLEVMFVVDCPNLLKLPFDGQSARRLRKIKGTRSWWDHLPWEDEATRAVFNSKFQDSFEADLFHEIRESTTSPPLTEQQEVMKHFTRARLFTYEELAKATDFFSNEFYLGRGQVYYEGMLPNGKEVAIKQLNYLPDDRIEEFEATMKVIGSIRHRHLVQMLGFHIGGAQKLIVYEFVSDNSLNFHLHGLGRIRKIRRRGGEAENDEQNLKWSTRMKIAIGSAAGLAYLHEVCKPKIILRNFMTDSILLDKNLEPKIVDYEHAIVCPDSVTQVYTDLVTNRGYVDPEYVYSRKVSDKSDVFSFGIVLLELVTGKPAIFKQDNVDSHLSVWARPILEREYYSDVFDPKLKGHSNNDERYIMLYCAMACVYKPARLRPKMTQIVEALQGKIPLVYIWKKSDKKFLCYGAPYAQLDEEMEHTKVISHKAGSYQHVDHAWPATSSNVKSKGKPGLEFAIDYDFCPRLFTYQQLSKATDYFSKEFLVDGLSKAYKGTLPSNEVVLIKKLKYLYDESIEKFEEKIKHIGCIRHPHLISLLGYYIDNGPEKIIVFEFVSNNSLKFHLHEKDEQNLKWSARMKIALGCARGLEYLHEVCKPKIIHRNFMANNVFLDEDFEPKIADYELSILRPDSATFIDKDPVGHFGYLDPEYLHNAEVGEKSDVFSFGIVLLELITGKPPIFKQDNIDLLSVWARPLLVNVLNTGRYDTIVNPKLERDYDEDEMVRMFYCAAACVYKPGKLRPRMCQIVEALRGNFPLENIWNKSEDSKFLNEGAPYAKRESDY